jgi:hypothetical protein
LFVAEVGQGSNSKVGEETLKLSATYLVVLLQPYLNDVGFSVGVSVCDDEAT